MDLKFRYFKLLGLALAIFVFLIPFLVSAEGRIEEGWEIYPNTSRLIDYYPSSMNQSVAKRCISNTYSLGYFVPTKTNGEFVGFRVKLDSANLLGVSYNYFCDGDGECNVSSGENSIASSFNWREKRKRLPSSIASSFNWRKKRKRLPSSIASSFNWREKRKRLPSSIASSFNWRKKRDYEKYGL